MNNQKINSNFFKIKFNHLIEPDIEIQLVNDLLANIQGKISIEIDKMISSLIESLGIKSIFDKVISKEVNEQGYFLYIRGIAKASISVKNNKLFVKAEYLPGREWWVKPIALIVLSKILEDFAIKIEKAGIEPGFRNEIKKSLQSLRKNNSAELNLNSLFVNQKYRHLYKTITLKDYSFKNISTYNNKNIFIIDFQGVSNVLVQN